MSRPPHARVKVLDAYATLLCEEGDRGATLEATAARAGVSKGGLLYHFPSKEALADAVLVRLREVVDEDLEAMATAEEGPARHYVRTSGLTGTDLDTYFGAVLRLAQAGHASAVEALGEVHRDWLELIRSEVGDTHAAEAIMLIGEGLYYHTTLPGAWSRGTFLASLDQLLLQVDRIRDSALP
ncbi:TetR family transcriptional regulator [Nocardioides pacificus]